MVAWIIREISVATLNSAFAVKNLMDIAGVYVL